MALHSDFDRWLTDRGIQPATLSILRKESILQESTLKLLTDDDLESLKKKNGISLGQFALLRSARDDLTSVVEEGFEVIEFEDVPGGRPGSADAHSRPNRNGASAVMKQNLEKGHYRQQKLLQTTEASEGMASSAAEYSRLAAALAEKKRKQAGKGSWSKKGASSSAVELLPEKSRASWRSHSNSPVPETQHPNYDHLSPHPAKEHTDSAATAPKQGHPTASQQGVAAAHKDSTGPVVTDKEKTSCACCSIINAETVKLDPEDSTREGAGPEETAEAQESQVPAEQEKEGGETKGGTEGDVEGEKEGATGLAGETEEAATEAEGGKEENTVEEQEGEGEGTTTEETEGGEGEGTKTEETERAEGEGTKTEEIRGTEGDAEEEEKGRDVPEGQTAEEDSKTSSAPATKSYADYDHLDNFVPKPAAAANTDEPAATTASGGEQPQSKEEENAEKRVTITEKDSSKPCCTML